MTPLPNDDRASHTVTITVAGRYPHGKEQQLSWVTVAGDGSLDHMLDTFRAALVAAGFAPSTAGALTISGG